MVKLKNLKKNNDTILCDVFPEDSVNSGTLVVNTSGNVIDYSLPDGYEWCINHIYHAARKIRELVNNGTLPSEITVMWN